MIIPQSTGLVYPRGGNGIEYVGGYTFDDTAESKSSSTISYDGNLTGGIDSNVQSGDLVIAAVAVNDSSDIAISNNQGFTELADLFSSDNQNINLAVYSKIISSESFITFTFSASVFPISAVMVFRGVDTVTPVGAVATNTQSNTGQPNPPSRTIPSNGLYFCAGAAASAPALGGLSNFTANDMDEIVTLANAFAALGLAFSFTDDDADQFGGGNTDFRCSAASMAVAVNEG